MTSDRALPLTERAGYWDNVYDTKGEDGVSWYQAEPTVTLELLDELHVNRSASLIDVGGGASVVVDHLLQRSFTDVSVLDVSKVALADTRLRLGDAAGNVHWLHRDIFEWTPERRFDLWHDRAVFHFLIEKAERDAYVEILRMGIHEASRVIVATFDADGPTHCSGLPVVRYGVEDLAALFAPHLHLVTSRRQEHLTPAGLIQPFSWVVLAP